MLDITAEAPAEITTVETRVAELAASELLNVLTNTILFVAAEKNMPILSSVYLSAAGGDLMGTATDRFHIGQVLAETSFVDPELYLIVPLPLCKALIKELKDLPKELNREPVQIFHTTPSNDYPLVASIGSIRVVLPTGEEIIGELVDAQYPKVNSLFPDIPSKEAVTSFIFNPKYLAAASKVKRADGSDKDAPMMITGGRSVNKPFTVKRGDWFRGLVMPVRIPEFHELNTADRFAPGCQTPLNEASLAMVKARDARREALKAAA